MRKFLEKDIEGKHINFLTKNIATFLLFYTDCQFIQNRKTTVIQGLFYTFEGFLLFNWDSLYARLNSH